MLKIIILSISLIYAPFLRADNLSSSDIPHSKYSMIYVYSDYQGILYIGEKKSATLHSQSEYPFGALRSRSRYPLEISNLKPGQYSLRELLADGEDIYCDVQAQQGQGVDVYLRRDNSRVGKSLEEINYRPYSGSRTWIYALIGTAVLVVVAGIIVGIVALGRSDKPGDGGIGGAAI